MTKDNKISKTKEEMKFYAKEFIKNVVKFPLIFIKRISIITLALCNTIAPIVIILLIPMSINWILVIATAFTIANIIIYKKIDNSDIEYENELTQTSNKFMSARYNFINLLKKLKELQKNNNKSEEELVNSKHIQKSPEVTYDGLVYEAFVREEIKQLQEISESSAPFNPEVIFELDENIEEQANISQREQCGLVLLKKKTPLKKNNQN